MRHIKLSLRALVTAIITLTTLIASAYDFMVDGIAYNILNSNSVEVTHKGSRWTVNVDDWSYNYLPDGVHSGYYTSELRIPESVSYMGTTYRVVALGAYSMSDASISQLYLPKSITKARTMAFGTTLSNVLYGDMCSSIGKLFLDDLTGWCNIEYESVEWNEGHSESFYGWTQIVTPTCVYNSEKWWEDAPYSEDEDWDPFAYSESFTINENGVRELYVNGGKLIDLVIPDEVTTIRTFPFFGNTALQTITLHRGVTRIDQFAFEGCTSLQHVYSNVANPAAIRMGYAVFNGVPLQSCVLHVPEGSKRSYIQAEQWCDFGSIVEYNVSEATSMAFDPAEVDVYVGETKRIAPVFTPSDANPVLNWTSSRPDVVDVNAAGQITGRTEGVAVVTATTADGSNLTASCIVNVIPRPTESISIYPTSMSVNIGNYNIITAYLRPAGASKNVVWTSSTPGVVSLSPYVDEFGNTKCKVTALKAGTTTVTISTTDGSNVSASCQVTVPANLVTSLTLNSTYETMLVGKRFQLVATVEPEDASFPTISWSSDKPSVATVDSTGLVTALSVGRAFIRAYTTDGSGLVATCTVIVSDVPSTAISINPVEATIECGQTLRIAATITPADASNQNLRWISSNTAVATVDEQGVVTGVGAGRAAITATTTDGSNLSAACLVMVIDSHKNGDVNGDGLVDIDDVNIIINTIIMHLPDDAYTYSTDIDDSGYVDIDDLNMVINAMLHKDDSQEVVLNTYTVNGVSFRMVNVAGGTFTMGATAEQGIDPKNREKPTHEVTLSTYHIGETLVTQALWEAVMGSNPSYNLSSSNHPVENVSYDDCQAFIAKLNQLTGKTFRLPTEAEWEYAARGGKRSKGYKYAGGNDPNLVAWYVDNSSGCSHAVGQKAPNELGLYDMSGNLWEICNDWYGSYSSMAQTNPQGPDTGTRKVFRGSSWNDPARDSRVSNRESNVPTYFSRFLGFRLAL